MTVAFVPIPTEIARAYQTGGPDAYGMEPERRISDGDGVPCRHCLKGVPEGAGYLILAHRPFPQAQPYAETGPIFLCAEPCEAGGRALPPMLASPQYILRGYGADDRIIYGTGKIVATAYLEAVAEVLLAEPGVAYAHVRSASNNCFQVRVERA